MGQKLADLDIHEGAVFTNTSKSTPSRGSYTGNSSYGRLFAFDSEGQHVLTCGSQSGIIYKVFQSCVTVWQSVGTDVCVCACVCVYHDVCVCVSRCGPVAFQKLFYYERNHCVLLSILQIDGKNLSQVLSLPYHKQSVMSVDWTTSLSCSTCLTGSMDGSIQITSLLKQ